MPEPARTTPPLGHDASPEPTFPTVRRGGFDPDAVRHYLAERSREIALLRERVAELRADLAASAASAASAAPRTAEIDEVALAGAVGEETGRILKSAYEAAHEIVGRAESQAATLLGDAEAAASQRFDAVEGEAAELVEQARSGAESLREETREACLAMVEEARAVRQRILTDLQGRRRILHTQLEQLRAAKNALGEIVESVSYSVLSSVEDIRSRIEGADEQARLAAASVVITPESDAESTLESDAESTLESFAEESGTDRGAPPVIASDPGRGDAGATAVRQLEPAGRAVAEDRRAGGAAASDDARAGRAPELPSEAVPANAPPAPEIDELFARIRSANRSESETAPAVLDGDVADAAPAGPAEEPPRRSGLGERDAGAAAERRHLVRRDELLGPAFVGLGRALRRALRLEENELRDAFRNLRAGSDRAALLPSAGMTARLADVCEEPLRAAWLAGATSVADILGERATAHELGERHREVREVAERLAEEVVEPIRRRIESGLADAGEDDQSVGLAVGAAFREWKGVRVDGVAGDFAAYTFSAGTIAAASTTGSSVGWIVDDGGTNCPDCDDNTIAGATLAGKEFPTGHSHPPIHPGCRCLLVAVGG